MAHQRPSRDLSTVERNLLVDAQARYERDVARALGERDGLIARLRADDASAVQIAETLGLTRQGVYDAVRRVKDRGREQ